MSTSRVQFNIGEGGSEVGTLRFQFPSTVPQGGSVSPIFMVERGRPNVNANIAMTARTSILISTYCTPGGSVPPIFMVERGEAKCEYKRFDDCDHFDFSFRMRYPKPTVNANASMVAAERKRPNVNANTVMTANNSIPSPEPSSFFI